MVLALLTGWVLAAAPPKIVVLKSADRTAYAQVVAGFSSEAKAQVSELTLEEGTSEAAGRANARMLEKLAEQPPAMVLAVGPTAANAAKRALQKVPVVFCMVPYFEKYGLEGPNVTGFGMAGDLSVELSTVKALGEERRRIGILHDPRFSAAVVEDARQQAKEHELTVVPLEVDSLQRAQQALATAKGKVDALLMVADKTVATEEVVRALIAFSKSAKVPLIALSPTQVEEGALLSVSLTPTGIGQQAGRLANRIVHEKVDPGALAVARPEVLEVSVNLTTAKALGTDCDLALELFKVAAQRGYPIKVYQ